MDGDSVCGGQGEYDGERGRSIVCPEESPQCSCRRKSMPHRYADSPKGVQGGERKATLLAP